MNEKRKSLSEMVDKKVAKILEIVETNFEYAMNDNPCVSKQGRYELRKFMETV